MASAMHLLFLIFAIFGTALSWDISPTFFTSEVYNFTDGWSQIRHINRSPPLVVQSSHGDLIHILDTDDSINLVSFDSLGRFKSTCDLALNLTYPSKGPRSAVALGNGKLVVWILTYSYTRWKHEGEWRLVIVDPDKCDRTGIEIPDIEPNKVDIIDIVGYENSFDVFIMRSSHNESQQINLFRYNDDSKPVNDFTYNVLEELESVTLYRPNSIRLHPLKKYSPSSGFLYVQKGLNVTVVKRLTEDFEVKKPIRLSYSNAYSTDHEHFGACRYYSNKARRTLYCKLLDSLLKVKVDVETVIEYDGHMNFSKVLNIDVHNTPDGGMLIAFALGEDHQDGMPVLLQRIRPDGGITAPENLGKIMCLISRIKIFEMNDNGAYCVSVTCDEFVHTRCIDIVSWA